MNKKRKFFIIAGCLLILLLIGIAFHWYFQEIYAVKNYLKTTQTLSNDWLEMDDNEYVAYRFSYDEKVLQDSGLKLWYNVFEENPASVLVYDSAQQAENFINSRFFSSKKCIFSENFTNENGVYVQYKYFLSDDAVPLVLNRRCCIQVDNMVIFASQSDIQWWNSKVGATLLEVITKIDRNSQSENGQGNTVDDEREN